MKKRTMLTVYSAAHFFVDFCCAFGMFSIVKPQGNWLYALLFYNFCAFALQMPAGIAADRLRCNRAFAVSGCMMVFCGLLIGDPLICAVILGIGNALFHVGGGRSVLVSFNKCAPLGIFVSPGALGLYFGTVAGKADGAFKLACFAVIIICAVLIFIMCRNEEEVQTEEKHEKNTGLLIAACVCLFAVVCIRSFAGMNFSFPWKTGALSFMATAAAVAGKTLGGVFYDKAGGKLTAVISLALSAVFLLFSENPFFGIVGVMLFNFTMPITLFELAQRLPEKKGFAFGMLTFALFIGFLPTLFGTDSLSGISSCAMAVISLALLAPFVGGKKNDIG